MISTSELRKLDVQTRLQIIDELWESVVDDLNDPDKPNTLPVSEAIRPRLDEQMREYAADPMIESWRGPLRQKGSRVQRAPVAGRDEGSPVERMRVARLLQQVPLGLA